VDVRVAPSVLLLGLLAFLGVPCPARAAPPAPPSAPDRAAVDRAIEAGVRWVLAEQRPDGAFGGVGEEALGETTLAALALLHAGLREDGGSEHDRRLARTLRWLDRLGPGRDGARDRDPGTYTTSLLLLVLRARGRAEDRPRMQRLADLLVRTQAKNGQWGYAGEASGTGPEVGDNSNTQFALLALGAAGGEGIEVRESTFARARGWWLGALGKDGGFGYASGGSTASATVASMTAAGIACLAILEAARPAGSPPDPELARVRETALGRLAEMFSVTKNEGPTAAQAAQRQRNAGRGWLHYYLWSVERALVLAERPRIAGRDWFVEGTAQLLATQKKDGGWVEEAPLYATCFALLFLTRAADPPRAFTPPPKPAGPTTPAGGAPPAPEGPAAPLGPADPRASPPPAPEELVSRALAEGPGCLARLVSALDDPDAKVRQRAFEALTTLLGPERVAGADLHPLARGRLALWVRRHARLLVAKDGRFVLP
jgi:hypothetical protein